MSLRSYHISFYLTLKDYDIETLLFAAMRRADPHNRYRLRTTFPELWKEFEARKSAPAGILKDDDVKDPNDIVMLRGLEGLRRSGE